MTNEHYLFEVFRKAREARDLAAARDRMIADGDAGVSLGEYARTTDAVNEATRELFAAVAIAEHAAPEPPAHA